MAKTAQSFFSALQKAGIRDAITRAELDTSGEIRVHIENQCKGDVLERSAQVFASLKMHDTKLRNGVLFYLAVQNRKFAILGDKGINAVVPENFWDDIKNQVAESFKRDEFAEGLARGIESAGIQLKKHFPYQKDDINELSDEISFGTENQDKA